jgi:hypothetical protein
MAPSLRRQLAWTFASLVASCLLSACAGCQGKNAKRSFGGDGGQDGTDTNTATPTATPTEAPTAAPTDSPHEEQAKKDQGDKGPEIDGTTVASIDTENGAKLNLLKFTTTDAQEAGRYLSEFLIVISSREKSCVRLKVRPTSGVSDEADDAAFTADTLRDNAPCSGQQVDDGSGSGTGSGAATGTGTGTGKMALALTGEAEATGASAPALEWMTPEAIAEHEGPQLALADNGPDAEICALRLFRMRADAPSSGGLAKVKAKTGQLVKKGKHLRVWVDEDFANYCTGGQTLDDVTRPVTPFAPLLQRHLNPAVILFDKLYAEQIQNLVDDMDKIYDEMTAAYGPVSDIDGNGAIELFISPEINRTDFVLQDAPINDHFRVELNYRLQDLAFYNSETNPLSNEGEIAYLWAPDPAGLYNGVQYPSSDSLTTNFAKGYLTAQLMGMIIANERLLVQKQKQNEDRWLVNTLATMASSYYAGNEFVALDLAQYLTSHPQYISLDQPSTTVSAAYQAMAADEQLGLQTMFGWYLHTRLCGGDKVAPCAKLKQLITSKVSGRANVEAVVGDKFDKIMQHFAASLGVSMHERRRDVLALFTDKPGQPPKPYLLPDLQFNGDVTPLTTSYTDLADPAVPLKTATPRPDPAKAGWLPHFGPMLYQPLAADSDMEFKTEGNSSTFILVTGLINKDTYITSFLGKGLNVAFIPLGERATARRHLHFEKLSETAQIDQRPYNLIPKTVWTGLPDRNDRTYINAPYYDTLDMRASESTELWIMGSIDTFNVNVLGGDTTKLDSDSYDVWIDPCAPPAPATCDPTKPHRYGVQAYVRDAQKQLEPILMVTAPDRSIFRGHNLWGRVNTVDPSFAAPDPKLTYGLCQSLSAFGSPIVTLKKSGTDVVATFPSGTTPASSSNWYFAPGDVTVPRGVDLFRIYTLVRVGATQDYTLVDSSTGSNAVWQDGATSVAGVAAHDYLLINRCGNNGLVDVPVFDHRSTALSPPGFVHTYQNYGMLGYLGFPYTTQNTTVYTEPCPGPRCFGSFEAARQFETFDLAKDLVPSTYAFYTAPPGFSLPLGATALASTRAKALVLLKTRINSCSSAAPSGNPAHFSPDASDDDAKAKGACVDLGLDELVCSNPCHDGPNAGSISAAAIFNLQTVTSSYVVCNQPSLCNAYSPLVSADASTNAWIPPSRFVYYYRAYTSGATPTPVGYSTYYVPVEPLDTVGYCAGEQATPSASANNGLTPACQLRADASPREARQYFNVRTDQLDRLCVDPGNPQLTYPCLDLRDPDSKVLIDPLSYDLAFFADKGYLFYPEPFFWNQAPYEPRPVAMSITKSEVEIFQKPERIHYGHVLVPGTGAVVHIVISGRDRTTGKYLIRVRDLDAAPPQ